METIKNTPELLILKGEMSETIANAIRRSVSEVPTLAIDEVEIVKNDSALYDEMLAHRLGLVALKTEKSMTSKTKVAFKLSKKGPGTVYASDLKGSGDVVYPKTPITLLGEDAEVQLSATAVLGIGLTHAKFVPGLVYYKHIVEVKSSPKADSIINKSKGLIKAEKKGSKWICDLSDLEIDEIEAAEKGSVTDTKELLFIVESYGNMSASEIFAKAITALEDNLDEFEKAVK